MLWDFPFWPMFMLSVGSLLTVFTQPFFYLALFLLHWQYKRLAGQQRALFGCDNLPVARTLAEATAAGLLGGLLASMLIMFTGLSINGLGLQYIWPLAIFLFLCNLRFLCFAYSGGLVALSNILFGWPEVAVPHVLALVAIMHVTEAVLVFGGGSRGALPVYTVFKGRAVGGFLLSNFWPLPCVLMVMVNLPVEQLPEALHMPDWWPLFPVAKAAAGTENVFMPVAVTAMLGYSSATVTMRPRAKRMLSGGLLFCYSVILLTAALACVGRPVLMAAAALFCFFGHELVMFADRKAEENKPPAYTNKPGQVAVLSTIYDSPAWRAGLKENDIILQLNGCRINSAAELLQATAYLPARTGARVLRAGRELDLTLELPDGGPLGIIRMPVAGRDGLLEIKPDYSLLLAWYRKFFPKR